MRKPVVKVCVLHMKESCGESWWVCLTNSVGQTLTPMRTKVRDNALMEADDWASFFGLEVEPYTEGGVVIEPSMRLGTYDEDEPDFLSKLTA